MRKFFHKIYVFAGKMFCYCCLAYWEIRDRILPPKANSILFVAHPDDDTLFFHTFIKENRPYVVLLFTGWSRRLFYYFKVMRFYGVRCRAYPTISAGSYKDVKRRCITEKHIRHCLQLGKFKTIAFHNSTGEYGHRTHKLVHESVMEVLMSEVRKWEQYRLLCPVGKSEIGKNPLNTELLQEKRFIFERLYKTEKWVMTDEAAGTPIWFYNERLEQIDYGNIKRDTANGT